MGNVAAAEQNMNARADLLKSTALQAKANLTQAEAALDAAMATANASVELSNWLRSARANHEDDKANVLMPEIDIVNERQKALFQQLVTAEKNATSIMYNAIKAAIKNRRLNETPGEVVQVLSGDKWVTPKPVKNSTNATKVQPNATNATDDEELEEEEETSVPVRHDHTVFKNHPPQNSAKFGTTCK